jgi:hypothetical protein
VKLIHGSRQAAMDCVLAFLATALLILPLFRVVYLDNWMSIEGSFIGDARYILEHGPHPRWHADWYCGTRFDYIYPPLTRYGAAIVALLFRVVPAQGYHIYVALLYCLGVAGVYFLARVGTRSRGAAWLAAGFAALVSPCFLFLPQYRQDSLLMMPQRLNVLVKWGEGPHMSALAVLPWAMGLALLAFERRRAGWALAGAALASAVVVSNNFYGAVALALLFPMAVVAAWIAGRRGAVWLRAAAIVALAYGLCAWWLTPTYLRLTARNLMLVAQPADVWPRWVAAVLVAAVLAIGWWRCRQRPECAYPIFLAGSLAIFAVEVCGYHWFGANLVGDPTRFVPELDLLLNLALVEGLRRLWRVRRTAAVVCAALCCSGSLTYLVSPWAVFHPDTDHRRRVEYRLTEWLAEYLPGARTFATGSLRCWFTTWRDLPQVGGASDQGMQSLIPSLAQWQITMGGDAQRDVDWLVALGADAIVTHEANSEEIYHGLKLPRKFMGKLPGVYDRAGDIVYRVPRRFPGVARVVDEGAMRALAPIPWSNENGPQLRAYAQAVEASASPVTSRWRGIDAIDLRGRTGPGESVLVQVTWDAGWQAWEGGRRLEIVHDSLDFMRIQAPPGDHAIRLVYELPLESRMGRVLSLLAAAVVACILARGLWV